MLSFLYQEIVGGCVFLGGLWLVRHCGELGMEGRRGRRLGLLLAGFALLALLQGALQWAARG